MPPRAARHYIKASNTAARAVFCNVALAGGGSAFAIGAAGESSAATGIDGNQQDTSAPGAGATYAFTGW